MSSVPSGTQSGSTAAAEVGARVRRLRLASGLGQVEFASGLGLGTGNSSVSMLENGRATITNDLLERAARALRCTPEFLGRRGHSPLTTQPLLRAYADAPKRAVDRQLADASVALDVVHHLDLRTLPDTLPPFLGDLSDDSDIEQYALDVRAAGQIDDDAVVGNAVRAAERLGCLVLPMPNELGRHMGMSVRIDQTPVLCVSRAGEGGPVPGDRQRFTVAHELGHLGLHSHLGPPQTAQDAALYERQAHLFAGAFLAPGDAMLEELSSLGGRVTLQTLASIKGRWGIAIKALVMRFKSLGVIDADHARSLYKQISARGWNKGEPVPVGAESAVWLDRAIAKRFASNADPVVGAAMVAGLDESHLRRWIDWTTTAPAGDLVHFPGARSSTNNARGSAGTVTLLSPRQRS